MKKMTGYMHGINLGGWLSQCDYTKKHYDTFITETDIRRIKSWGLDHIRVPVDYNLVEDDEGNYIESGFRYIENVIRWAADSGLNMILDLHKTYGYSFDPAHGENGFFDNEDYQERFYKLWEEFARRFGMHPNNLCFELLNEVTDKEYCDKWNQISRTCIERIRKISPEVRILIGGYYNNSIEALPDLLPPYDDKIIYNFHCYEPLIFTHQGAPWVEGMNTEFRMHVNSTYGEYKKYSAQNITIKDYTPGMDAYSDDAVFGAEFFEDLMAKAVKVAEERNVPLYCGEFGVIDRAESSDALEWYKMICSVFDRYDIGRAAWSYKAMDYGFVEGNVDSVVDEMIKLL